MQPSEHSRQSGFSLVELMVAVIIIMILGAYAVPNTMTAIANIKLRGSAVDFAGLVQQARLAAVQKNATYTVLFGVPSGNGAYFHVGNGSFVTGDPMIQFGGNVNQVAAPGGTPTTLDSTVGWTPTAGNVSFNARGLPCDSTATPCGTNVNYIFYFMDTRALGGNGWAAVSITAASRVKVWYWNGSSWIN